jgi:hypothetical protein
MRIFDKRNGVWTMRHNSLSQNEFSKLIIIICVCVWATYASGVTHVWFPVLFVIIRVREVIHGWIIRDTNIFVFVKHVRDNCRPTVTFVAR